MGCLRTEEIFGDEAEKFVINVSPHTRKYLFVLPPYKNANADDESISSPRIHQGFWREKYSKGRYWTRWNTVVKQTTALNAMVEDADMVLFNTKWIKEISIYLMPRFEREDKEQHLNLFEDGTRRRLAHY